MHALAFQLKRAHRQTVSWGRRLFERFRIDGMTPARFDLLYALRSATLAGDPWGLPGGWPPLAPTHFQRTLGDNLGLHRATISVMLKRLEELGWIRRTRDPSDRRRKYIALTKKGLTKIFEAMKLVFRGRRVQRVYQRIFQPPNFAMFDPSAEAKRRFVRLVHETYVAVARVARFFGDESRISYDLCRGTPRPTPPPPNAQPSPKLLESSELMKSLSALSRPVLLLGP
jgi:DNA-binding MarR family transcriptional regulator